MELCHFYWSVTSIIKALEQYQPEIADLFKEGNSVYYTAEEKKYIEKVYAQGDRPPRPKEYLFRVAFPAAGRLGRSGHTAAPAPATPAIAPMTAAHEVALSSPRPATTTRICRPQRTPPPAPPVVPSRPYDIATTCAAIQAD